MARQPRRAILAVALAGLAVAACVAGGTPPPDALPVEFDSRDAVFLDDLMAGGPVASNHSRTVTGLLGMPTRELGVKVPAAVILHTSSGPSALEWSTASALNAIGIASLVVDSFGPRGVRRSGDDQTRVTEATMMADAYGALAFLAQDPRIRADRIAVIGFSKGAAVALYSAMTGINQAMVEPSTPGFAAHLAYYPWCGLSLFAARTTGAPVMIHMGEEDDLMSPTLCREWVDGMRRSDAAAPIDFLLYPGARHAFNHPVLAYMPPLTMTAQNPGNCRIVEIAPGIFRETSTGRAVDHGNYRAVLAGCLGYGGVVAYDTTAAELATQRSLSFLYDALFAR
jgi:dienelactone hydrolase